MAKRRQSRLRYVPTSQGLLMLSMVEVWTHYTFSIGSTPKSCHTTAPFTSTLPIDFEPIPLASRSYNSQTPASHTVSSSSTTTPPTTSAHSKPPRPNPIQAPPQSLQQCQQATSPPPTSGANPSAMYAGPPTKNPQSSSPSSSGSPGPSPWSPHHRLRGRLGGSLGR